MISIYFISQQIHQGENNLLMVPVLNLRKEAVLWSVKTGNFIKILILNTRALRKYWKNSHPIPNVMSDLSGSVSDIIL